MKGHSVAHPDDVLRPEFTNKMLHWFSRRIDRLSRLNKLCANKHCGISHRPSVVPTGLILVAFSVSIFSSLASAQRGQGPSRVVAGNVIKTTRASTQSFVGSLQATRKTTVGSAVDGRVVTVNFEAGDPVSADPNASSGDFVGQPLVEIRTDTLKIEMRTAQLQYEQTQQALEELKLTLPQNLETAKANQARFKSEFEYNKSNYQRLKNLQRKSSAISTIEVEQARSQYVSAEQALIGSRSEVRRLSSTSDLQLAQAKSRVDAALQETLRMRDLMEQYTIRAPFAGIVTQKLTEVGQWVTRGEPMVEIVELNPIEMVVNIPQEFTGRLQDSMEQAAESNKPMNVKVEINGIEETFAGQLMRVIPQADLRSRSFPVRIRVENPPSSDTFKLKPGMLGRVSMMVGKETEAILVKKDALVLGSSQNRVFKVVESGKKMTAVPVPVTTGIEIGSWVQVVGNLSENDKVIIVGNERLRPGAEVLVTESKTEKLDE